jgi:hypothetical protein
MAKKKPTKRTKKATKKKPAKMKGVDATTGRRLAVTNVDATGTGWVIDVGRCFGKELSQEGFTGYALLIEGPDTSMTVKVTEKQLKELAEAIPRKLNVYPVNVMGAPLPESN